LEGPKSKDDNHKVRVPISAGGTNIDLQPYDSSALCLARRIRRAGAARDCDIYLWLFVAGSERTWNQSIDCSDNTNLEIKLISERVACGPASFGQSPYKYSVLSCLERDSRPDGGAGVRLLFKAKLRPIGPTSRRSLLVRRQRSWPLLILAERLSQAGQTR
jgi:hypothetical protein